MTAADTGPAAGPTTLAARVRAAILWRSGSQIAAQMVAWGATFFVIRLLDPADYGLFALTQMVLVLLNLMNGYGVANALIRREEVDRRTLRQALGLLILLNTALAAVQVAAAPLVADFYGQPAIATLLRVQALAYFATPFLALPYAILSRAMDFRSQARVRMVAALCGALTALSGALAGWGVWALVAAPMVLFYVEAVLMTTAARAWMMPLFRFDGARDLVRYGGAMTLVQLFWFLQSQADIFMAGRVFVPHQLGIYTTALFLAQLLATKFVPPVNEVAYAAYARLNGTRAAIAPAFLTAVRLVMLVAAPCYLGLALTAAPLVDTMLGTKWREVAALIPILALAMPLLTLQLLFAPATNALDRPGIAVRVSMVGGVALPLAFLAGLNGGLAGLAWAWVGGMAVLLAATMALSLRTIGVTASQIAIAVAPAVGCAMAMAAMLLPLAQASAAWPAPTQLAVLTATGAAIYAGLLLLVARRATIEALALVRGKPIAAMG